MPRIRTVPLGQEALWPPTVSALAALAALPALGTVPSAAILMSEPLSEPLATLAPVTALLAIFPPVTDFAFSWREPTLFFPSAAKAVPERAATNAITATTSAGEGRPISIFISSSLLALAATLLGRGAAGGLAFAFWVSLLPFWATKSILETTGAA